MVIDPLRAAQEGTPAIEFFMLADRAEAVNGKLYVMGGAWDTQFIQDVRQPLVFSFALSILFPPGAGEQQVEVEIAIEDAAGGQISSQIGATVSARREGTAPEKVPSRVLMTLPMIAVPLPAGGIYYAVARIVGGPERRVMFRTTETSRVTEAST